MASLFAQQLLAQLQQAKWLLTVLSLFTTGQVTKFEASKKGKLVTPGEVIVTPSSKTSKQLAKSRSREQDAKDSTTLPHAGGRAQSDWRAAAAAERLVLRGTRCSVAGSRRVKCAPLAAQPGRSTRILTLRRPRSWSSLAIGWRRVALCHPSLGANGGSSDPGRSSRSPGWYPC